MSLHRKLLQSERKEISNVTLDCVQAQSMQIGIQHDSKVRVRLWRIIFNTIWLVVCLLGLSLA
jgi:hypothetical protein